MKYVLHVSLFICILGVKLWATPTIDQMISQMIMVGFNGTTVEDKWVQQIALDIEKQRIGGVVLTGRNIKTSDQLKALTAFLHAQARETPLLVATEQEGGEFSQLSPMKGFTAFLSAFDIMEKMDLTAAFHTYTTMARLLKEHHINYNLAPVVDIAQEDSPSIGQKGRSFSPYANIVSVYSSTFVDAFAKEHILTTLKHFPGYGSASKDAQKEQADISLSWQFDELKPYYDMIKTNKITSVMVSNLYLKRFDLIYPAMLSEIIVNGLLRERMGYQGVVISDDMLSKGISRAFSLEERVVLSINAGVDILLFSDYFLKGTNTPKAIHAIIKEAVTNGAIQEKTIHKAYERIIRMKKGLQ